MCFGLYPTGMGADFEVRSFAPGDGIPEDPVCGSGNGCVAALVRRGRLSRRAVIRRQSGTPCRAGRSGLAAEFEDDTIWLRGYAVT
jgi:predicted PhzF superfamily epimerase YddE/YHI9